ncbi:beta-phosphoglucomutase [Spiroplasma culicicola]|uniref:Beta-phosphoglucomutase n=1 Tax=Spiroplasma culicicola AES-1 TaxID=1276246 RepID=W6A7G5_9MOLU|nr:beta-phosphoglucomutase [Spiroplasma culicicola]AHI52785.1 beta-phosphoglucomutase [Spiroplasma culicicola AES-1]
MKLPKLAIFDCDGVITKTAHLHYFAWKQIALEKLGIDLDETYLDIFRGLSRIDSLKKILAAFPEIKLTKKEEQEFINLKNDYYKELIKDKNNIELLTNTVEFIKQLKKQKVLIALASTSRNSKTLLELFEIDNLFDYIVDPDDIATHKPNPEIFLNAAQHFNINPSDCWGIEDANVGVEAIKRANMFCIGIGSKSEVGNADIVFDNCDQLNLDEILNQ